MTLIERTFKIKTEVISIEKVKYRLEDNKGPRYYKT